MNPTDYLRDVPQENYFRLADGRIIKNLEELFSVVQSSGDTVFYDHVTPDRNDYASWIRECVKSQELYNKLIPLKDKQSFLSVLSQEIAVLKNPKISETMKFFSEDYDPKKENQPAVATQVATTQTPVQSPAQPSNQTPAAPVEQSASFTPSSSALQNSQASTSSTSMPSNSTSSNTETSDSELDFEQVLGSIIQEIQEEIFFWQ
jgi:hypothetical protein